MNLYDTKSIFCIQCGKAIGEIDYESKVTLPICGKCECSLKLKKHTIDRYELNRFLIN